MKNRIILALIITLCACGSLDTTQTKTGGNDSVINNAPPTERLTPDTVVYARDTLRPSHRAYQNKRFRNVAVQQLSNDTFLITGQGQIFEASFNWIIEDGHEELQHSYATTDAGAPEWGNFSFKIHAPKKRSNTTLHLVLFETSAKDGSRQHELPLFLH